MSTAIVPLDLLCPQPTSLTLLAFFHNRCFLEQNLWNTPDFWNMSDTSWKVVNGTSFAIEGYAQLERDDHIPCPKISLMMGLMNGATAPVPALNAQIQWVRDNYPPSAFVFLDGKPLLMMFDGGNTHGSLKDQINASGFTLRWVSAFLNSNPALVKEGFWSWMDDEFPPTVS